MPGPACRAYENLHFGNFQLSKARLALGNLRRVRAASRIRGGVHRVNSVTSLPTRFASKCNFLISHWGNGAKNLDLDGLC